MAIFSQFGAVERSSIDEVYLDLTERVQSELEVLRVTGFQFSLVIFIFFSNLKWLGFAIIQANLIDQI